MDWEDVRFFAALARAASLSAAARALGVNHTTVSRRIGRLEADAGTPLFERGPTGFTPTGAGSVMLEAAAEMEAATVQLRPATDSAGPTGLVRLTATPAITEGFLIPRLAPLQQRHPGLEIEIFADRRLLSLSRHETDLALRLGQPADSDLLGQRVAVLVFGLYATPANRDRFLAQAPVPVISFDESGAGLPEAVWLAEHVSARRPAFLANGQMAQLAAARAGLGVAVLPHFLARMAGDLVPVPLRAEPPTRELLLLSRANSDRAERLRVVKQWLTELFRRERQLFAGG